MSDRERTGRRPILETILVIGVVAFAGWRYYDARPADTSQSVAGEQGEIRTVHVGEATFRAEVVRTTEAQQKGLGGRDRLCSDCAMLFVFKKPDRYGFWMKDMRFSLDMLWIRGGRVIGIDRNIPADSQEIFTPEEPADLVLEIGGGRSEDIGIREGDAVRIGQE